MCGISGFIDFNKSTTLSVLEQMNRSMQHRGPDGEGYALFETPEASVGLGHRRLSIIDLSEGGKQPMQYGSFTITFNGEIYNYNEIKQQLIAKGHIFQSTSDTEVILHAFAEWGNDCAHHFIGMFAIAIYDEQQHKLTLIRDRAGVKPLFYYLHEGLFLFASELKAFHQHPRFVKELNHAAVAAFLQYGHVPTPHCIFKQTHKLATGHILEFGLHKKQITIKKYWDVYDAYNQPKLDISFEDAIKETERILTSAFQYRMVADVPVGVFLSGGYDSTCVAAILQKNSAAKIKTFTIGVGDKKLNEAPFAKETAKYLGTEHYEYYCTEKDALDLVKDLPFYYDEPFGDSSAIPTMLVSKMARQEVTVALSADAGDECFAGYNRHDYLMRFGAGIDKIPSFLRKGLASAMNVLPANKIPVLRNQYNFHNRYDKLKNLLQNYSPENVMLSLSQQYSNEEVQQFFSTQFEALSTTYDGNNLQKEFYTPLSYMLAVDYQTYLPDDILQKVDRATMAFSLEGREPFLDHRVIEWAAQLPDTYKYHKGEKKYILKQIVHKYVPQQMMERPKTGFAVPIAQWLEKELKPLVEKHLNKALLEKSEVLNPESVQKILDAFYSGRKEYDAKLWNLLMFQMWYDKWMR